MKKNAPQALNCPAYLVRHFADGQAALREAEKSKAKVFLVSAPDAAAREGALWFKALSESLREKFPEARFLALLDCGDSPGFLLEAVSLGGMGVIFTGKGKHTKALGQIAEKANVPFFTTRPKTSAPPDQL